MIREFKCRQGHVTELLIPGINDEHVQVIDCPAIVEARSWMPRTGMVDVLREQHVCGLPAHRVEWSAPSEAICVGEGFHKPAAGGSIVGRADVTKYAKEVFEAVGGHKNLVGHVSKPGEAPTRITV